PSGDAAMALYQPPGVDGPTSATLSLGGRTMFQRCGVVSTVGRRSDAASAPSPMPTMSAAASPSSIGRLLARAPTTPGAGAVSAARNSDAVAKRSAGSFSSALRTQASRSAGRLRGSSDITRATMAWAVGPENGGSPASISYTTQPNA